MVLLLFFTSTVTPYEACFMKSGGFDGLFYINRVVDLGFLIDMALQFNTIIIDRDGTMITDRSVITTRYLKGWFPIDLLSVMPVPFDILSAADAAAGVSEDVKGDSKIKMLRFTRLFRLIKLARIVKAMRIIAHFQDRSNLSYSFMAVAKQGMMVIILLHWNACLYFFAATLSSPSDGLTWIDTIVILGSADEKPIREMPHTAAYIRSLFNSVSILYGGTCADGYVPNTDYEYGCAIVLCIISAAFYGYALGGICAYFDSKDPAGREYRQVVDNVNSLMSAEHIPKQLKNRTREYFRHAKEVR